MSNILTQFAHIFIHYYSNKASSTCKLFISEPSKAQDEKMGRLFGILEINTPSRENAPIITQLISYLEDYYYSQIDKKNLDIESIFEQSLEEANQKFFQIIQDKQFYLVGNLNEETIKEKINFVIGVLKDDKIFISYLNNIGIYLIHKTKQDYKLIDIKKIATEEKKEENEEKNSKLFTNVIKGELKPDDYLFLANFSFLDYISLERIKKITTSLPVHKAAEYFKNSLLQHEGHNFASIIIKNSDVEPKEDSKSPSLTSITELNATESSTANLLTPSLLAGLKGASRFIGNLFKKNETDQTSDEEIKETAETETMEKIETTKEDGKADKEEPQTTKKEAIEKMTDKTARIFKIIIIFTKTVYKKICKRFLENSFLQEKLSKTKSFLRLKLAYLGNYLKKIPDLSKILLILAILLIILFIYSTSYFKHQHTEKANWQEFQNIANQIKEKVNQAESNIIFGDEKLARSEITEAQKLLTTLPVNSQKQKELQEELNREIEVIIAKLRHITTISEPSLITDSSNQQENNINIQNIIYQDNLIFAFDSINNNSYQINLDNREVNKIYSNLSDIGSLVKAKKIEDRILIYHDNHGFVEFKNDKFVPLNINLQSGGKTIDFATYYNRLYTVDINNNQIYRQPKTDTGYGAGLAWLKENFDLSNINSIGIDTNIWLLSKNGRLLKFNKGRKQNFEIKNLEPKLEAPTQLFTNDETNYLYILEPKNQRIVVLDKEGNLVTQYYSEKFDNLKSFIISEKEKKIFVVNDNKILFFNLTHL